MELLGDAEQLIQVNPGGEDAVVGVRVTGRIEGLADAPPTPPPAMRRDNNAATANRTTRLIRLPQSCPGPLLEGARPPYPARPTRSSKSQARFCFHALRKQRWQASGGLEDNGWLALTAVPV